MRRTHRLIGLMLAVTFVVASCGGGSYPDLVEFTGVDASLFRGPDHCDWDGTWMVHVRSDEMRGPTTQVNGEERSAPFPGEHMFVRNPDAIQFGYEVESDLQRSLPDDAIQIGISSEGYAIWFADSDPDFIYVESSDRTEAWVRAVEWGLCV